MPHKSILLRFIACLAYVFAGRFIYCLITHVPYWNAGAMAFCLGVQATVMYSESRYGQR